MLHENDKLLYFSTNNTISLDYDSAMLRDTKIMKPKNIFHGMYIVEGENK